MKVKPIAMRDAFLDLIYQEMKKDDTIFFLTGDFGSPVLDKIRDQFPKRFANVGIAEQNLINISAGLAVEGYKIFAYAIAPFITMRCYEQIRVNLALLSVVRNMNVTLIGVGAGYSYVVSGPTHQCYEDLSIMRAIPNINIYSPSDHIATASLFKQCLFNTGIKYLRLDAQVLPVIYEEEVTDLNAGFNVLQSGESICIIATGYVVHTALNVACLLESAGIKIGVIDLFDLSKFSTVKLANEIKKYKGIVTLEEGFQGRGGLDSMMFEFINRNSIKVIMENIGVEGGYRFELGSRAVLHEKVGIGVNAVTNKVADFSKIEN